MKKPDPADIGIALSVLVLLLQFFCHVILPRYS